METIEYVKCAVNALSDKKGEKITVIDISEVSTIADYFIIAVDDIFAHHRPVSYIIKTRQLFQYKIQVFFAR